MFRSSRSNGIVAVSIALTLAAASVAFAEDFEKGIERSRTQVLSDRELPGFTLRTKREAVLAEFPFKLPKGWFAAQGFLSNGPVVALLHQLDPRFIRASGLRADPAYRSLPSTTLQTFDERWIEVKTVRDDLLMKAAEFDAKDAELEQENDAIKAKKAEIAARVAAAQPEANAFNRECAGRKLPPEEYARCSAALRKLKSEEAEINAEIVKNNAIIDAFDDKLKSAKALGLSVSNRAIAWAESLENLIEDLNAALAKNAGTCTKEQHRALQSDVNVKCKQIKRACNERQDCTTLKANLAKNQACFDSRKKIIDICYGGQPDEDHKPPLEETQAAIDSCLGFIRKNCGAGVGATGSE